MNVFLNELKMSFKSMIVWTLGLVAALIMFMAIYPPISKEAKIFETVVNNLPPAFRDAFGLSNVNFSNILGFYSFIFVYVLVIGGIYAMKAGISALSEEPRSKTTDFLLAKPIKRINIINSKILSVLALLFIQNIVFFITSFIVISTLKTSSINLATLSLINLSLIFLQMFFISLGLLLSVILKKLKTVLPVTLGIVFGFFVIQMINQSLNDKALSYITPFAYFDVSKIIKNASYDMPLFTINIIFIVVATILTYIIYNKKDMPSV